MEDIDLFDIPFDLKHPELYWVLRENWAELYRTNDEICYAIGFHLAYKSDLNIICRYFHYNHNPSTTCFLVRPALNFMYGFEFSVNWEVSQSFVTQHYPDKQEV